MTVNLSLEKDGKQYSVTSFSKAISTFLIQGKYWSPLNSFWKELTFNFPTTGKIVVKVKQHQSDSEENVIR